MRVNIGESLTFYFINSRENLKLIIHKSVIQNERKKGNHEAGGE